MRREIERDEGLARLSRGTWWLGVGALVSAGMLSAAAAESLPGRSSAAPPGKTTPTTVAVTPSTDPASSSTAPATSSTLPPATAPPATSAPVPAPRVTSPPATTRQTLSPPTAPPQTTYHPPVVSSGGS